MIAELRAVGSLLGGLTCGLIVWSNPILAAPTPWGKLAGALLSLVCIGGAIYFAYSFFFACLDAAAEWHPIAQIVISFLLIPLGLLLSVVEVILVAGNIWTGFVIAGKVRDWWHKGSK